MDKKDKIWVKSMDWCSKYWGCHQLPERSFFINGFQFPVCARCTGIILGYIISLFYSFCFKQLHIAIGIALIIPMSFDGLLQLFTNYSSTNIKRFMTGVLAGFGFIHIVKSVILFVITCIMTI